tara:strand:+ start:88 stop:405 length:318 start_codon:yes stop_codon:yes gene_type:complete
MNKSLVSYSLIFLILVPIFGLNFLISFLSNILLLIFLIPLLIFLISFIGLNSLKSKVKTCSQCGMMNIGANDTCMNCGTDLNNKNSKNLTKASETTIEVKAEEVT